jgi:hypothetical protein
VQGCHYRKSWKILDFASSNEGSAELEEFHAKLLWGTTRDLDWRASRSDAEGSSDDEEVSQIAIRNICLHRLDDLLEPPILRSFRYQHPADVPRIGPRHDLYNIYQCSDTVQTAGVLNSQQ